MSVHTDRPAGKPQGEVLDMLNTLFRRSILAPLSLRLWLTLLLLGSLPTSDLWAQAALDSPGQGSFQSGINLIHGWRCEEAEITVVIDDAFALCRALYGAAVAATRPACASDEGNNGWGSRLSIGICSPSTSLPIPSAR